MHSAQACEVASPRPSISLVRELVNVGFLSLKAHWLDHELVQTRVATNKESTPVLRGSRRKSTCQINTFSGAPS